MSALRAWIVRCFGGEPAWAPSHQHRKGGLYRLRFHATLEADRSAVAVYDDADGNIWVRSRTEFEDGRFTPLADGPPPAH